MACTVTPKQVYTALTGAGFSTVQAIGIMANGINESSLQPEARAVDSNGRYSNGLLQWNEASYPTSGGLVTGNCTADLAAQVGFLKATVSGSALNGSTGAEVAGNFAQYFERCVGCQPGGAQNNQRVANAATVEGWISSGKWPAATGPGVSGGGSTLTAADLAASQASLGSTCLIGFGGVPGTSWVNDIFGSGGNVGQFCILSKSEVRALLGGLIIAAGGLVAITGVLILAAYGLKRSGALDKAANVAAVVPGGQGVAAGLALASNRSQQTGQGVLRQRQAAERESAREAKAAARKAPAQDETA